MLLNIKRVLIFCTTVWNISHSKRNLARCDHTYNNNYYYLFTAIGLLPGGSGLRAKYSLLFQILMKLKYSRQIFEKCSNTKFYENLSSGSRGVACERTDIMKLVPPPPNFQTSSLEVLLRGFPSRSYASDYVHNINYTVNYAISYTTYSDFYKCGPRTSVKWWLWILTKS